MNSDVIDKVLRKNCGIYRGVSACDKLPDVVVRPSVIVATTDPASRPGRHWICVYFDGDGHGEYFDSFGMRPPLVFERYFDRHCFPWSFSNRQRQSLVSRFLRTLLYMVLYFGIS